MLNVLSVPSTCWPLSPKVTATISITALCQSSGSSVNTSCLGSKKSMELRNGSVLAPCENSVVSRSCRAPPPRGEAMARAICAKRVRSTGCDSRSLVPKKPLRARTCSPARLTRTCMLWIVVELLPLQLQGAPHADLHVVEPGFARLGVEGAGIGMVADQVVAIAILRSEDRRVGKE